MSMPKSNEERLHRRVSSHREGDDYPIPMGEVAFYLGRGNRSDKIQSYVDSDELPAFDFDGIKMVWRSDLDRFCERMPMAMTKQSSKAFMNRHRFVGFWLEKLFPNIFEVCKSMALSHQHLDDDPDPLPLPEFARHMRPELSDHDLALYVACWLGGFDHPNFTFRTRKEMNKTYKRLQKKDFGEASS